MSNFVVSARKYRPNRFVDVVGQQHVSQTLKNALNTDHLAHAFLFCGPRGVGKTTCARILAKVLNCQTPTEDYEPCNTCSSCESFNQNASFNITELDAASNNSVEHIRALIEQVRFQPQQGKYKIYIIDEVHMLSQQAFNAFLKTLEEPPSYAIFILATTEKHKIIPTILSRCQIFDFNRIQIPDMVSHLEGICTQEGIKAEKDALHIVAQKADGALRDALSIFDRIVSFSGDNITYDAVIENLNVLDYDYYFKIIDAVLAEDMANMLLLFDNILRKGFEPSVFINGLAAHIRNLLVCKNPKTLQLLEVGEALQKRYHEQANLAPTALLLTALNITNDCDVNYKLARNKRLHVEMAIIKMCYINQAITLSNQSLQQTAPQNNPVVEKKKDSVTTIETNQTTPVNETVTSIQTSSTKPAVVTETKKQSTENQIVAQKPKITIPNLNKPKVSLLDSLEDEVVKEEKEGYKVEKVILSVEKVKTIWDNYAETKVTSKLIQSQLKSARLEKVDEETMKVCVSGKMMESNIRLEGELFRLVKKELNLPNLNFQYQIDESTKPAPIEAPKVLTDKDRYKIMLGENPLISDIQKTFDLRLDKRH